MRIAIVSDIHGNRTALEAVLADLRQTTPDLIFHGGDLADAGASPVEVLDQIRDLGWPGVVGNSDEMLFRPESLQEFAAQSPKFQPMFALIEEMAAWTREALGAQRLAWLSTLPRQHREGPIALVHAHPDTPWRSPGSEASDSELEAVYGRLGCPVVVYGHIHRAFVRHLPGMIVANTGSVSLSYDGDTRASYLLLDDSRPAIRRVQYDVDRELTELARCGRPHSDWVARTLRTASPQMP
jgi:putative phosphoesterase